MAWRLHDSNLECTQVDNGVFGQWMVFKTHACLGACTDERAGLMRQLAVARDKVRVQMGVENMCQRKTKIGSGRQVPIHVAQRVYQNPLFGFVGTDQVGRVTQSSIYEGFDK